MKRIFTTLALITLCTYFQCINALTVTEHSEERHAAIAEALANRTFGVAVYEITVPNSRAMQLYSGYRFMVNGNHAEGNLPTFKRDRSERSYDGIKLDGDIVKYKSKYNKKEDAWNVNFRIMRAKSCYMVHLYIDHDGMLYLSLDGKESGHIASYRGQLKTPKNK